MKLAISGKGGTGKTTLVGTMARELGRQGNRVTAIDADPNPTLASTLGIDVARAEEAPALPTDILEVVRAADGSGSYRLRMSVPDIVRAIGLEGPDGVTLLIAGRVEHAARGCNCSTHAAVRAILGAVVQEPGDVVLVDMEAGVEHLSRSGGTLAFSDALMIVVEPFYKSMVTGRQLAALSAELGIPRRYVVGNKVRSEEDAAAIEEFSRSTGLELIGTVPWDPRLQEAEAGGVAPLDFDPTTPGVRAAQAVVGAVTARVRVAAGT